MLSLVFTSLRRKWRALPIVVVCVATAASGAEPIEIAGTMPEDYLPALKPILETALRQSYTVVAREIEREQSAARVLGADSLRLPSVGGQLNYARNQTAISSNTDTKSNDNGVFYNFGLNQPLYHWGALQREGEKARINALIADKNYREASRTLAVALRRAYLELIVKKAKLRQLRYSRDLLAEDLKSAKEKLANGQIPSAEVAGRELNFRDFGVREVQRAEIEFATLRRSFSRLAGIPDLMETAVPDEIPRPNHAPAAAAALLSSFVKDGGRSTFQLAVSELKVREAEANYRIAAVRLLPKFNAGASYSLENTTNASTNSVSQQGVARQTFSISAQWNIFDGFATRAAKRDTLAAKRAAELNVKNLSETIVDNAQSLAEQLELDAQEIELADTRVGIAVIGVKRLQDELALGTVSRTTIDNALAGQKVSEAGSAAARAVYLARWSEFASLTGIDPVLNQLPARHDREKR